MTKKTLALTHIHLGLWIVGIISFSLGVATSLMISGSQLTAKIPPNNQPLIIARDTTPPYTTFTCTNVNGNKIRFQGTATDNQSLQKVEIFSTKILTGQKNLIQTISLSGINHSWYYEHGYMNPQNFRFNVVVTDAAGNYTDVGYCTF